ncbi:MAG: hypothetical protein NZ960_08420 [Candidatus Kapabacteria bacterium]|nr:hypothetical protein [Candidatus Kapabacteria bacterium]
MSSAGLSSLQEYLQLRTLPAKVGRGVTPRNCCSAGITFAIALLLGCADLFVGSHFANLPPETVLWVDTVGTPQRSRAQLFWRGDDPDGFVVGFLLSLDAQNWTYTTRRDTTVLLPVGAEDTAYSIAVAAVDNSLLRYPQPGERVDFSDLNGNGLHDDGEPFRGLEGAVDPTPARLQYPVRNSPPRVFWGSDTTPAAAQSVWLPETTFTVATFRFTAVDPDGPNQIAFYEWALNDTARWHQLPPTTEFFTLRESDGLRPGESNRLYLRAVDVGGLRSPVLEYPPPGRQWYVRKPRGPILVLHDYAVADGADTFYTAALGRIAGGRFAERFDVLDIRSGRTAQSRPRNVPPFLNPMFVETLRLFEAVLWYGDPQFALDIAQAVLPEYVRTGGKLLLVTTLPSTVDPQAGYSDIVPIDSLSARELFSSPAALPNGTPLLPDSSLPDGPYPLLLKDRGTAVGIHALYPNATAAPLYRLPPSQHYAGTPVVAVRSGNRAVVFLNFPLHLFNRAGGAERLLERVLVQDFGLQ